MRLVILKEPGAEPVDGVQHRVPGEGIAGPAGHHAWDVENAGDEIQDSGQLPVGLFPRPAENGEDGIDVAKAAAERRGDQQRHRRAPNIIGRGRQPDRAKADEENRRDNQVGHDFQEAARGNHIERRHRRQLQHRAIAGDGMAHPAAGVNEDVIGDEAGIRAQTGQAG